MTYPKNDNQFEESVVDKIGGSKDTDWWISSKEGTLSLLENNNCIEPVVGMSVRYYGKGMGYPVRGVFLDGKEVYYRTEEEHEKKSKIDTYGADAKDWLARWDKGRSVWSIEMGGLGPGYEQCIQITCAEVLRWLLDSNCSMEDWEGDENKRKADMDKIDEALFANTKINQLGLSGAQHGAAVSLACMLYKRGPIEVMTDDRVKDRHIQVSSGFPS